MKLKEIIFLICMVAASAFSQSIPTIEKPNSFIVDGVLAHVNGKPITKSDVYPYFFTVYGEVVKKGLMKNASPAEIEAHCLSLSLEEAINNKLILDAYYGDPNLTIPQKAFDQRINDIIERDYKGNKAYLMEELAKRRLTYQEWKKLIEENVIVSAMVAGNVVQNIHISNGDIYAEYQANKDKYTIKATTHLGMLQAESNDIYTNVVARLEAKEDFSNIIKEMKLFGSNQEPAGSIGWVNINEDLTPIFAKQAADLKVGEISAPIEVDGKYYFIKKFDEKAGYEKPFAEVHKEIEASIFAREVERLKAEWIKRLRSEAAIKYEI